MKTLTQTLILNLFLLCTSLAYGQKNFMFNVDNKKVWDEAKQYANDTQKPIFLFFYSDDCLSCKELIGQIVNDGTVRNYIDTFMVSVTANTDSSFGRILAELYFVVNFPAIVIANMDGGMLKKVEGDYSLAHYFHLLKEGNEPYFASFYSDYLQDAIDKRNPKQVERLVNLIMMHLPTEEQKRGMLDTWKMFYFETENASNYEQVVIDGMAGEKDSAEYLYEQAYDMIMKHNGLPEFASVASIFIDMHMALLGQNFDACYLQAYICTLIPDIKRAKVMALCCESMAITADEKKLAAQLTLWINELLKP